MKVHHEIFKRGGILVFLVTVILVTSPSVSKRCKEYLMKSYNLDGMHHAEEMSNPMCPSLEYSCCTKVNLTRVI